MARKASNRTWSYPFRRNQTITIAANAAGNHLRTVLLDNAEVGTIERAYFSPTMTTWAISAPYGWGLEQYATMKDAGYELVRRALALPAEPVAGEIPAFS